MKSWYPGAFALLAALQMLGIITGAEILIWTTKPLLMPVLALWLYQQTKGRHSVLRSGWLIGLAFSTLGDVLLMFPGSGYFLAGLSAFLLAHISFIIAVNREGESGRGFLRRHPAWILPLAAYLAGMLWWLWNGIPVAMRAPVAVYATVISTMLASVINLRGQVSATVFSRMLPGALLFVLSDSMIAVNKFGPSFTGASAAIMATYIAGQYLLAGGVREWLKR